MRILVVGGGGSGVGKTTLICRLIEALPGWAAIKVSPVHDTGAAGARRPLDHGLMGPYRIDATERGGAESDTARLRTAGADPVLWIRSRPSRLGDALSEALSLLAGAPGVIIEGNSAARHLETIAVVFVTRWGRRDVKPSAAALARNADWVVLNRPAAKRPPPRAHRAPRPGKPGPFVVDAARPTDPGTVAFLDAIRAWARR